MDCGVIFSSAVRFIQLLSVRQCPCENTVSSPSRERELSDGHCAPSEMVAFGSGQGLSVFATTGIVLLFRGLQKSENAARGQKMLFPDGH